jgi:hypothetical protein
MDVGESPCSTLKMLFKDAHPAFVYPLDSLDKVFVATILTASGYTCRRYTKYVYEELCLGLARTSRLAPPSSLRRAQSAVVNEGIAEPGSACAVTLAQAVCPLLQRGLASNQHERARRQLNMAIQK